MKERYRRRCPDDCNYKDRRSAFCGFCMLDILERRKESSMQMMVDINEMSAEPSDRKEESQLKRMVDDLKDGEVLQISLEGVVVSNGQET